MQQCGEVLTGASWLLCQPGLFASEDDETSYELLMLLLMALFAFIVGLQYFIIYKDARAELGAQQERPELEFDSTDSDEDLVYETATDEAGPGATHRPPLPPPTSHPAWVPRPRPFGPLPALQHATRAEEPRRSCAAEPAAPVAAKTPPAGFMMAP
jgi:hypothetical protein